MRRVACLLATVLAAVAVTAAAAPSAADAARKHSAKPRQAAPKAACARAAKRPARPRRRAVRRRLCVKPRGLRASSQTSLMGVPGAFAAPAPFATRVASAAAPSSDPAAVPTPTPTPSGPVLPPIYSNPRAVQVQAFEFGFQLSKSTVSSGDVRVEFNLVRAEDPHNLLVVRSDGSGPLYTFDEEQAGAVTAKYLALTKGKWTLLCGLEGHEALGMKTALTVVD